MNSEAAYFGMKKFFFCIIFAFNSNQFHFTQIHCVTVRTLPGDVLALLFENSSLRLLVLKGKREVCFTGPLPGALHGQSQSML